MFGVFIAMVKNSIKAKGLIEGFYRVQRSQSFDILKMSIKVFIIIITISIAGCGSVKPWEKKHFSNQIMEFRAESSNSNFLEHTLSTIEQSEGGYGEKSVGCGCK